MLYQRINEMIRRSDFMKNMITLMLGSGLAVLITVAASPLLTRLFSPEEFGHFALYASIVSIVGTVAALRYDFAIILPPSDRDALALLALSFIVACIFSIIAALLALFMGDRIMSVFDLSHIAPYFLILPVSIFLVAINNALIGYFNRHKRYKRLSTSKVVDALANNAASLGTGTIGMGAGGFVWGHALGKLFSSLYLLKDVGAQIRKDIADIRFADLKRQAIHYREFPGYSVLGSVIGSLSTNLHVILFLSYYGDVVVGVMALATRILLVPLQIISASFGQVFFEKLSRIEKGTMMPAYLRAVTRLTLPSLLFILVVWLLPANTMTFIFGPDWQDALIYMRILVFWFAAQFVSGSVSTAYTVLRRESWIMWIQAVNLVLTFASVYFCYQSGFSVLDTLKLFVLAKVMLYLVSVALAVRLIWVHDKKMP